MSSSEASTSASAEIVTAAKASVEIRCKNEAWHIGQFFPPFDLSGAISDKFKADAELCNCPEAREAILESLTRQAKEARLQGFEFVKAVHLEPVMWTPESEVMTPTLKLKRPQLRAKYNAQLDAMREQLRGKK